MPRIENWQITGRPLFAADPGKLCVTGIVSGRQGFKDGDKILTSAIRALDLTSGVVITRSGTVYELGIPLADSVVDPNVHARQYGARSPLVQ